MANIFAQHAQPVRSVMDYQGDFDAQDMRREQLGAARRTNALADLTAQQTRQTMADAQRTNAIIKAAYGSFQPGVSDDTIIQSLQSSGDRGAIEHAQKLMEQKGKKAEIEAKTREAQAKALTEVAGTVKRYATGVMANPTPQSALQAIDDMEAMHKQFGLPGNFDAQRQQIAQMTSPDQIRQWAAGHMGNADLVTKKLQLVSNGKVQTAVDMNPVTNPAGPAPITMTTTPGEDLSAQTSVENNKRTVAASLANASALRDQAQATRDAANIQTGFANETSLRKEFEGLSEIKNYKQAYPAYAAIKDAATRNTPQSDINIVYGIAKLYDPTSVVREGEYATVANSPNIPERIKGYAQYLAGGGKLSPETKKQILAEAEGRIKSYQDEAVKARKSYEGIAKTRGMKPEAVFQAMGDEPGAGADAPQKPKSGGVVNFGDLK